VKITADQLRAVPVERSEPKHQEVFQTSSSGSRQLNQRREKSILEKKLSSLAVLRNQRTLRNDNITISQSQRLLRRAYANSAAPDLNMIDDILPASRSNRLKECASPFVSSHAESEIHWYSWDDDFVREARSKEKLIFMSIGSHLCHPARVAMRKETYSSHHIAKELGNFVCVKVDYLEHPEIGNIYQKFLQLQYGMSGWPLSMFLTPDMDPVSGWTYMESNTPQIPLKGSGYHPSLRELLSRTFQAWVQDSQGTKRIAKQHTIDIRRNGRITRAEEDEDSDGDGYIDYIQPTEAEAIAERVFNELRGMEDAKYGGFLDSKPMKFLHLSRIGYLHRYHENIASQSESLAIATRALKAIVSNEIFDHVNGGAFRHSLSEGWSYPEFEKPLRENALLLYHLADNLRLHWPAAAAALTEHNNLTIVNDLEQHSLPPSPPLHPPAQRHCNPPSPATIYALSEGMLSTLHYIRSLYRRRRRNSSYWEYHHYHLDMEKEEKESGTAKTAANGEDYVLVMAGRGATAQPTKNKGRRRGIATNSMNGTGNEGSSNNGRDDNRIDNIITSGGDDEDGEKISGHKPPGSPYFWTLHDLKLAVDSRWKASVFALYFGMFTAEQQQQQEEESGARKSPMSPLPNGRLLAPKYSIEDLALKLNKSHTSIAHAIQAVKEQLRRSSRTIKPKNGILDKSAVFAWNALAVSALCRVILLLRLVKKAIPSSSSMLYDGLAAREGIVSWIFHRLSHEDEDEVLSEATAILGGMKKFMCSGGGGDNNGSGYMDGHGDNKDDSDDTRRRYQSYDDHGDDDVGLPLVRTYVRERRTSASSGAPPSITDYAYFVRALLDMHELGGGTPPPRHLGEDCYLKWAVRVQQRQDAQFFDHRHGGYWTGNARFENPKVLLRLKEEGDEYGPNPSGVSCENLLRLYRLTGTEEHKRKAMLTLGLFSDFMESSGVHSCTITQAILQQIAK